MLYRSQGRLVCRNRPANGLRLPNRVDLPRAAVTLALHNHHATCGRFPAGGDSFAGRFDDPDGGNGGRCGTIVHLLPYLEQVALYEAIKRVVPLSLGAPWNVDEVYQSDLSNVQCPSNFGSTRQSDPVSNHPGGVNVGMLDGSVRFVADTINCGNTNARAVSTGPSPFGVWGAMGSPGGGEALQE